MKIKVGDIAIEYDLDGPEDAPVVVLHHSLATSHEMWDDIGIALAQHYRVLSFDARGHGASDAPGGAYDFPQLARDVTGLMDALDIDAAHHVGLSMGGMVCQCLGFMAPERVESLILVSTASTQAPEVRTIWDERLAAVRANGLEPQVEPTLKRWFTRDYLEEGGEVIELIRRLIRATPIDGYCGWGAAIRNLDFTASLKDITAPTLVIVGREDLGTPPAVAEAIQRGIDGARLEIFSGVSHMLPLQAPDQFIETVIDFIEDAYEDDLEFDDNDDDEA